MVLGKLPVPGRSTNLNNNRARAYCASNRCEMDVREVGCQLPVAVYPFNRQLAHGS